MRFFAKARCTSAVVVLLATVGCGSSQTPIEPDPVYEQKTEVFSGALAAGGVSPFHFPVVNPGAINLAITQLSPISTLTMGLRLGSWDATANNCPEQLGTSVATLNAVFTGNPSGPGEYCVAIVDVGNVQTTTDFTLTVTHY
jgi:hypothetical protein